MIKTELMEDMFASIKRLNEELDSRCQFEEKLLKHIDSLSIQLAKKEDKLIISEERVATYMRYWDDTKSDTKKLVEFVKKTFLKDGQQIVLNAKTKEYEIVENP